MRDLTGDRRRRVGVNAWILLRKCWQVEGTRITAARSAMSVQCQLWQARLPALLIMPALSSPSRLLYACPFTTLRHHRVGRSWMSCGASLRT